MTENPKNEECIVEDCDKQKEQSCESHVEPCETEDTDDTPLTLDDVKAHLSLVADGVAKTEGFTVKIMDEIHQLHRLYHNEYAGRLRKVESELHRYQEIEKGRAFDGILSELAGLYVNNIKAVDEIADPKLQKRFSFMFMDLLQILEANGVSKQESVNGDKRNARYCQVADRVLTDNPALHDVVEKSLNVGFYVENRPLVKEIVNVYVYDISEKNENEGDEQQ